MDDSHYHTIIVGSGFGGSVMAYRLAEAGLSTCVLERGRAYPPGSFARSPREMASNFWDPSAGMHGLFNVWSFPGIDAIVSSGLGGGSLIYANVLLRKDERWFVKEDPGEGGWEYWPVNRADLDPHYDRVERMMRATPYPIAHEPYASTPKTVAFRGAAAELGLQWGLTPLAVTFAGGQGPPVPGEPIEGLPPNLHGATRFACRLCGECDIGCNYGSKNTLDYNYLSEAKRLGATLRTRCEVQAFSPRQGGGYEVRFVEHLPEHEGAPRRSALPVRRLTCDHLVLSAGTLGSTFLLLKNRAAFPAISRKLGSRFSGNGDFLTGAFECHEQRGGKRALRRISSSRGPVITSFVRVPDAVDGPGAGTGRGFYVEDAGYPDFVNWIVETAEAPGAIGRYVSFLAEGLLRLVGLAHRSNVGADVAGLLQESLTDSSLVMLGMGRDIPNGTFSLDDGMLQLDWRIDRSSDFFRGVRATMDRIARSLDGRLVEDPLSLVRKVVTVHPLGGCAMGRDADEGVVDSYGRVFNYPGLYVADGAVMPGPVGANPSLTIAALSDRFAGHIIDTCR